MRIEDTDRSRYDPHSEQSIFDSLKWLGLHWDQGPDKTGINSPYVQSKRTHFYIEAAEKLIKSGVKPANSPTVGRINILWQKWACQAFLATILTFNR